MECEDDLGQHLDRRAAHVLAPVRRHILKRRVGVVLTASGISSSRTRDRMATSSGRASSSSRVEAHTPGLMLRPPQKPAAHRDAASIESLKPAM